MGRVKLNITKRQNIAERQVLYSKRRPGIMKKAQELSILCDIDVLLLMFSPAGRPTLYAKHSTEEIIAKFAQVTPHERANRALETVEALKKTVMKAGHNVDFSKFLDGSTPTVQVLSERVRFLQARLSDIQSRVSNWTNIEHIDSVDRLQRLEISLRHSLDQIHVHKASMQQQLMSSEYKNQLQTEIDIDFGAEMEQELENFSSVSTNENMNDPLKEEDPGMQIHQTFRDITCAGSSSPGLFTKTSDILTPKLETSSIPGTSADTNLQSSNLSFLNDQKLQELAEWNLLGSPADYYVRQMWETSDKTQFGGNNSPSSEMLPYGSANDDPLSLIIGQSAK